MRAVHTSATCRFEFRLAGLGLALLDDVALPAAAGARAALGDIAAAEEAMPSPQFVAFRRACAGIRADLAPPTPGGGADLTRLIAAALPSIEARLRGSAAASSVARRQLRRAAAAARTARQCIESPGPRASAARALERLARTLELFPFAYQQQDHK